MVGYWWRGPNSELRMPQWREDPIGLPIEGILRGYLKKEILITSKEMGYQIRYSVYLLGKYKSLSTEVYPIIYVTDGYEYKHERMGNMATLLNSLIALKKIKPIIVVFIDQREPENRSNNRRMVYLAMNEHYHNL